MEARRAFAQGWAAGRGTEGACDGAGAPRCSRRRGQSTRRWRRDPRRPALHASRSHARWSLGQPLTTGMRRSRSRISLSVIAVDAGSWSRLRRRERRRQLATGPDMNWHGSIPASVPTPITAPPETTSRRGPRPRGESPLGPTTAALTADRDHSGGQQAGAPFQVVDIGSRGDRSGMRFLTARAPSGTRSAVGAQPSTPHACSRSAPATTPTPFLEPVSSRCPRRPRGEYASGLSTQRITFCPATPDPLTTIPMRWLARHQPA